MESYYRVIEPLLNQISVKLIFPCSLGMDHRISRAFIGIIYRIKGIFLLYDVHHNISPFTGVYLYQLKAFIFALTPNPFIY